MDYVDLLLNGIAKILKYCRRVYHIVNSKTAIKEIQILEKTTKKQNNISGFWIRNSKFEAKAAEFWVNSVGLLPQRGETRASRQVGLICLLGGTEQWLQTRCLEGPWGVIYNKEGWERDQHSRQSASQVGIYRASPMVLGGKTSPELTCYLLFLKRSQGSRFFLVCPHVYIFTTYCFFF